MRNHIAKNCADSVEALVGGANVIKAIVVQENLLDNEDGNRLAELRARLHDAKTQRDDFGREEEVDDVGRIILHQGANHAQAGKSKVFERSRLGGRVEERIEEEGDVGCGSRPELSFVQHGTIRHNSIFAGKGASETWDETNR